MFYAVLALLATIGKGSAKHSGVIALFDLHFVKTGVMEKGLSKAFYRAFEFRQRGDYGEFVPTEFEEAREIEQSAEGFVMAVQNYLAAEKWI